MEENKTVNSPAPESVSGTQENDTVEAYQELSSEEMEREIREATQVTDDYGEDQIQVLEGLEAVRKRPGMMYAACITWSMRLSTIPLTKRSLVSAQRLM